MLRKKGIIFLVVLVALIALLSFIFTDTWLEHKIENFGSSAVGAKVELDGFDLSLLGLYVKWDRLQVTDRQNTMKNLFETATCKLDFEFWPLLSKKIIVENMTMSGFRANTNRETDGKLSKEEKEALRDNVVSKSISKVSKKTQTEFSGLAKKANIDSVLKIADVTSVQKIDSLYESYNTTYQKWNDRLKNSDPLPEITKIEQQLKAIDVENLKDLKKVAKALEQAAAAKKSIDKLTKDFKKINKDFNTDFKSAQGGLTQVDNWLEEDYKKTIGLLKLPEISATSIGKMVFGNSVITRFQSYLGYVQTGRSYAAKLKSDKPEKKKPARLKGQDIYFYNPNARPDFWIKKVNLSGITNSKIQLEGSAENIVSDQKIIGQPTKVHLGGKNERGASVNIDGLIDYQAEVPHESFNVGLNRLSLAGRKLADSPFLPQKVKKGNGTLIATVDFLGDDINSKLDFRAQNVVFEPGTPAKTEFQKIVKDILQNTSEITFKAKIKGQADNLKYSLSSNLDDIFIKNLKARFGKELDAAKAKIEKEISKKTEQAKARLDKLVSENEQKLKSQLAKYQQAIDEQMEKVKAKEKELNKKKKKLSKDATKKLKNLF